MLLNAAFKAADGDEGPPKHLQLCVVYLAAMICATFLSIPTFSFSISIFMLVPGSL